MPAYPSLQNIAPHVWGPHAWRFMHAVALTYPVQPTEQDKRAAFQFFSALEHLLPCEACKLNYTKELKMFPLVEALESKQQLNEWLTALHNSVNKRLNKPVMTPEQVLQYVFEKSKNDLNPEHNHSDSKDNSNQGHLRATTNTTNTTAPSSSSSDSNSSTCYVWAIVASSVAGVLLIAVIALVAMLHKQKKVLR